MLFKTYFKGFHCHLDYAGSYGDNFGEGRGFDRKVKKKRTSQKGAM